MTTQEAAPASEAGGGGEERTVPSPWRPDRVLLGVLVVAALVRIGWCVVAVQRPETFGDPFAYLNHAEDIARGDGYRTFVVGAPTAYYPVGYPALLGGALWLAQLFAPSTDAVPVATVLNLVAGVATVWFVHELVRRMADRRTARVAAVLVALWPGLVLYTSTAHLETVFTALVTAIAWLVVGRSPADALPGTGRLLAVGVLLATATMVRPVVVPFLAVLVVVWHRWGWSWWRSLASVGVVVLVVLAVAVPWSVRSTMALGGRVLISTNTGDNLCVGHSRFSQGHYHDLGPHCWPGFEDVPADRLEVVRDRENTRRALDFALENPGREVELLVRKTAYLVQHDHEGLLAAEAYGAQRFLGERTRTAIRIVADTWWYVVGALAVVGAALAWRGPEHRWRVVVVWAAILLAVPLVFFGGARFHVPAIPFLAAFAAVALVAAADRWRPRSADLTQAGARPGGDQSRRPAPGERPTV